MTKRILKLRGPAKAAQFKTFSMRILRKTEPNCLKLTLGLFAVCASSKAA
jgi:hypothetical protein